jgi:hypothetical protein
MYVQATEATVTPGTEEGTRLPPLEEWSQNELMRQIPSLDWMIQKLDGDLRRRISILWLPYSDLAASDPRHLRLEAEFRSLCRSLDRLADIPRRTRGAAHPPSELGARIHWAVDHAVGSLVAADRDTFGRRFPSHTGERSYAEPLRAALLRVIDHLHRLTDLIRPLDPGVDEQLLEGLVQLVEPLRREPIA